MTLKLETPGAFVGGCQILDGVLLAHECVDLNIDKRILEWFGC